MWNRHYRPRGSALVYNTGRPLHSVLRLISEKRIEVPDALVCSEGTEIYWFDKPWLRHSHEVHLSPVLSLSCTPRQDMLSPVPSLSCTPRQYMLSPAPSLSCTPHQDMLSPALSRTLTLSPLKLIMLSFAAGMTWLVCKLQANADAARPPNQDAVPDRDGEWRQILMASWDYPKVKETINGILDPHRNDVSKLMFLPDPEYEGGQPMIVIAVEKHETKDAILGQIDRVRKERGLPFEVGAPRLYWSLALMLLRCPIISTKPPPCLALPVHSPKHRLPSSSSSS